MKNALIITTIAFIASMFAGSLLIDDSLFQWAVATTTEYQLARVIIVGFLVMLLVSKPPRHMAFRIVLGMVAVSTVIGVAALVAANGMPVLDAVIASEVAIIFALEALETVPKQATYKPITA